MDDDRLRPAGRPPPPDKDQALTIRRTKPDEQGQHPTSQFFGDPDKVPRGWEVVGEGDQAA